MLAAVFQGIEKICVEQVPDPEILAPEDIIVRTEAMAICGSDLHVFFGRESGLDAGTVMGQIFDLQGPVGFSAQSILIRGQHSGPMDTKRKPS